MPLAGAYTEQTLIDLMLDDLGDIGAVLGWGPAGGVELYRAMQATLRRRGLASVDAETDIGGLEAVAKAEAWRAACKSLAARVNTAGDGLSRSAAQLYEHARSELKAAEAEIARGGHDPAASGTVYVDRVRRPDPYAYWPDEVLAEWAP